MGDSSVRPVKTPYTLGIDEQHTQSPLHFAHNINVNLESVKYQKVEKKNWNILQVKSEMQKLLSE